MELLFNFLKSTMLATLVFWGIIFTEQFTLEMLPFVFLSVLPIFIVCIIAITFTIRPFFWVMETEVFDRKSVFRKVFPFYSMICFAICIYGILMSSNAIYFIAFFSASFISTSQSWVWFTKEANTENNQEQLN